MHRKSPIVVILIICITTLGSAISFRRAAEIPNGAKERAFGFDTDHDGKQNLVFGSAYIPVCMQYWEHIGFDRYVREDTASWSGLYDVGYLDADSLVDMVGNINGMWPYPMFVYESPTQNSNPTNIVWQDTGFANIYGGYITDLDQDGLNEILFRYYDTKWHTCVYENTGDNQYSRVWEDTINPSTYFVDGDFDQDGRTEFVTGRPDNIGGMVRVWECFGDNDYQLVFLDTLPKNNNHDVFSANDMDDNGKPEFLFTCVNYFLCKAWLFLYETIGDNNYDFILIDSITGIPGAMMHQTSICGDIDADGTEEIVWSTFNQWHIYKAVDVQQYQRLYSSPWTTHDITAMSVYDLNENGYPEVIESWEENTIPYTNATVIWEIEGVRLHLTWEKFDPPGADSFSLFLSIDHGQTFDTITTDLTTTDTSYLWTVPDSVSDSCKIMIWAYGPPRSGEQEPRGTAWDFSDSLFSISDVGVTENNIRKIINYSIQILQNPVLGNNLKIQLTVPKTSHVELVVYNVLGQVEEILVDGVVNVGIHVLCLDRNLPVGVHYCRLEINNFALTEKIVILR